jgi:uncharacterized membrane protein (UPF0127 family)
LPSRFGWDLVRVALAAALFVVCTVLVLGLSADNGFAQMRRDKLDIVTTGGRHSFDVEIAESDEDKQRGLMFRRSMAENAGMLFPYWPPQEATMWMRNTYISLDMVFIRADGTVHRIEHGTEPFSERVIASQGDVSAVLELVAGVARKIGLKPGDKVEHGLFKRK